MLQIKNWRKATCSDVETDGLLDVATKLHVVSYKLDGKNNIGSIEGTDVEKVKRFLNYHLDNEIPLVMHNGIDFDKPVLEKLLGIDLSKLMIIDTLFLSYYLNTKREKHGLDSFFDDYGIRKPPITDWEGLTYEQYKYRCEKDVAIQDALWEDLKARLVDMYSQVKEAIDKGLVGGARMSDDEEIFIDSLVGLDVDQHIDRILTFLMFKADMARVRAKTGILLDRKHVQEMVGQFSDHLQEARKKLESAMPPVPKYAVMNKPKRPFKLAPKNTTEKVYIVDGLRKILSADGVKWNKAIADLKKTDEFGNPLAKPIEGKPESLKIHKGLEKPNAGSSVQIKKWLFSYGWKPSNFKFEDDKDAIKAWEASGKRGKPPEKRKVPQVSVDSDEGKTLCRSVVALAERIPQVMFYDSFTTIKHRYDTFNGFLANMDENDVIYARVGGLANTLREKHRVVVNLPSDRKPYGLEIRGSFIARKGMKLLGSDLSSLEDRCKHHFMLPFDPEYVKTMMADDYDPHLLTALSAGLITEEQFDQYKGGNKEQSVVTARASGKACLPVDNTEVLTVNGWKRHDEVSVGDLVLSMNTETKMVEPCKVLDTVFYENQQIINMKTKSWSIESTGDHRWFVDRLSKSKKGNRIISEFRTTEELNSMMKIHSSGKYVGGSGATKPIEAKVLGWLLSDGYFKVSELSGKTSQGLDGRRQGFIASIAQSDKKFLHEIEEDLKACGLHYEKRLNTNSNDVYILFLKSEDIRNLFDRVGLPRANKHDIDYTDWVLSLSYECLESFFDAFWKGDGLTSERVAHLKTKTIYQNQGSVCDAVQLCSELLGRNTYRNNKGGYCILSSRESGMLGMQNTVKSLGRVTDVFCLTTENGNFVVRQNGFITVTGNCNYASTYGAQPPTIARSAGVSLELGKKLFDGYWKLNWAVKAIAESQYLINCSKGLKWLVNPINGFCYNIRKVSDVFSTLNQGTGSFFFDMWVDNVMNKMQNDRGCKELGLLMHDELMFEVLDSETEKDKYRKLVLDSIEEVNQTYKLRRRLGCDVDFGDNYSQIH